MIATIAISGLFAATAAVADDTEIVATAKQETTADTASINSNLAESATTAAVEDAIEAVLAENKLDLDIRFVARTSMEIADSR